MKFFINDTDWSDALVQGVDEYMMILQDSIDSDEDIETLSGEPYCGCSDCYWRELLFFVTPRIMVAQNEGKVELDGTRP